MAGKYFEVSSAGGHLNGVHLNAFSVLSKFKIEMSKHTSYSINEYLNKSNDIVITVCNNKKKVCPIFSKSNIKIHCSIDDPPKGWGKEGEQSDRFRASRPALQDHLERFINRSYYDR